MNEWDNPFWHRRALRVGLEVNLALLLLLGAVIVWRFT